MGDRQNAPSCASVCHGAAASDIWVPRILTETAGRQASVRVVPFSSGFEGLRPREIDPIPAWPPWTRASNDAALVCFFLKESLITMLEKFVNRNVPN